ncbi:MAG TPA: hypothetical protein PLX35_14905 [Cyclobacteriaceae bacterium]|nr:hypothetical protein [Cyclobacteriaceae bacterium]
MDNKLFIGLVLTCYLLVQCQSRPTQLEDFVGKEYRELNEFDFFKDYKDNGGYVVTSPDFQDYVISNYSNGHATLLLLTTVVRQLDGKVNYIINDIHEISGLKDHQYFAAGECSLNGNSRATVTAVREHLLDADGQTDKVIKAWNVNWTSKRLEPIGTEGVTCIDLIHGDY